MSLETKLAQDLKTAMKTKDDAAKRGIRSIKSAILLAKTDGSGTEVTADQEIKILQKLVKQRRDSLAIYEAQDREDLAKIEREEIAVIERYLPQQMDETELTTEVDKIIAETGASSMKDMGKVMGIASKRFAGRADGRAISTIVKQRLG